MLHLPCAIQPTRTSSQLRRPEGFVNQIEFCLKSDIDRIPFGGGYDVGSKPWLVAKALSESESNDCDSIYGIHIHSSLKTKINNDNISDYSEYPEDKFHIKLPSNVDQYTGVVIEDNEIEMQEELPEDRFHKKDAASLYLIQQREQAVKDKWTKHEKYVNMLHNDNNEHNLLTAMIMIIMKMIILMIIIKTITIIITIRRRIIMIIINNDNNNDNNNNNNDNDNDT